MSKPISFLRTHGGCYYSASWIISHFPANYQKMNYFELFAGGANVLLQKEPSQSESLNELNPALYDLWKWVINNPFALIQTLMDIPYSEESYEKAQNNQFKHAGISYFVKSRMSRGGTGKGFAWSNRFRRGMPEFLSSWMSSIDVIPEVHKRFAKVNLYNKPALEIIKEQIGNRNSLWFCDPPFLPETRSVKSVYEYEITYDDHVELLENLVHSPANVALLGYESLLYKEKLKNWNVYKKVMKNHSGQNKTKEDRKLMLWTNY
jgi:DNA adenine methylase